MAYTGVSKIKNIVFARVHGDMITAVEKLSVEEC